MSDYFNQKYKFLKNFWKINVHLNPKKQYGQLISPHILTNY